MQKMVYENLIQELADYVLEASVGEVLELSKVLDEHPNGEEIKEAVSQKMLERLVTELEKVCCGDKEEEKEEEVTANVHTVQFTSKKVPSDASLVWCECECGCEEEGTLYSKDQEVDLLAESIKQQVEAMNLSNSIQEQLKQKEEAKNFDLSAFIKEKIDENDLTEQLKEAFAYLFEDDEEVEELVDEEEEVFEALDRIVDHIVKINMEYDNEGIMPLSDDIMDFFHEFVENALARELKDPTLASVEFDLSHTGYVLTEVASRLVQRGYQFGFVQDEGSLVPALVLPQ